MSAVSDETVEALVLLGLSQAEAERAVSEDRVALALVNATLSRGRTISVEEAAQRSRIPAEYLAARDRALGLPPEFGYTDDEVAELAPLAELLQVLPAATVLRNMRSDAQAMTRIAMSNLQLVNDAVAEPLRAAGGSDVAVAIALAELGETLLPASIPLFATSFRRILTHLLSTEMVVAASRAAGSETPVAVGFVDVVGYTSLSARIDPRGLDDILEAFESRCYIVAGLHDVQLVKFLGDAALFVSVDAARLAETLLAIVTPAEEEGPLADAPIRGGLAYGSVLPRAGDYFGPPVNLAARLTDHARPGTVLADESLADTLSSFHLRRTPPMRLRGLGFHRPFRVRLARE
jgi:adenylate cyclase